MAMLANVSFALRAIMSKVAMASSTISKASGTEPSKTLSPPNAYSLVAIPGFLASLPLVFLLEGRPEIQSLPHSTASRLWLVRLIFASGLTLHLCNEVMYLALGQVHPITLAVGNTMKRALVMMASVIVFGNVVTGQAALGSAIGLAGVFLYSYTKQVYEKQNKT